MAYRFMDEETDLYTSRERPVYSLLNMTKDATAGVSEYHSEGNVSFSLALQYQEDLPENVKEKVLELGVFDETVTAELKESLTPDSYGYYDIGVYVNCVGDYINLGYSETAYGWDNESGDQCYSHYLHEYYCYHRETGELVELEDLFHEQWNPEQVITDGMYKHQRKLSDLYDDIPKEDSLIRDEVHRQYAHLTSFAVDTTCLNLAGSYVDEETGETRNEWISVPYEDIGCYLMTIFD
ncbi:MAG: hypothetical protein E7224_06880 [Clostridiales bacterium]|nr:hypothetical protein [Clostridiales bacterium]